MKMHRVILLTCSLAGGLCATSRSAAAPVDCVSFYYPPMVRAGPEGIPTGLAVDIVTTALQSQGHQVRVRLYPWSRALAMVREGQADCIFTVFQTPARAAFLDFSGEALDSQSIYLYARAGSELVLNGNVDLLARYRIGTARSVLYGDRFEAVRARLDIDEAATLAQSFVKLALGRVDVVPCSGKTAAEILALPAMTSYAPRIVRLPMPIETVLSYVGFSRKSKLKGLREQFDAGLRDMTASGAVARLREQHSALALVADTPER